MPFRAHLRHPYFLTTAGVFLALLITLLAWDRPVKSEREVARRIAEGKEASLRHHVPVWLWRGLCVNVALAAGLVALTPLAARRLSGRTTVGNKEEPGLTPTNLGWRQWLLISGAAAIFVGSGVPRLHHSLWGDEENLVGSEIADHVSRDAATGQFKIEPASWQETLWGYDRPTNHIGYTVVARLFHDTFFRPGAGATDPFFSETLVRLPVLLSGIGWIFALVWCCRVWGFEKGAAPVALALAGHAWMTRFGVDARGYGFVVLLVFLMIAMLGRALQTGRWRWWIGFGLAQFYLIWVHPGSVHGPVMLNLAALVFIACNGASLHDRVGLATRLVVANVLSAMLVIGLMAPILTPFLEFLARHALHGELDLNWFKDAWAYLSTGAPWLPWASDNPYSVALRSGGLLLPDFNLYFLIASAALAGWGIWRVVKDKQHRWLVIFLLGGPALMLVHVVASGTRPYHWYLIPFLPALLLLWAAALQSLGKVTRFIASVVLIGGVHVLAAQQATVLRQHPIEAIRESVAVTRTVTNPRHPDYGKEAITGCCIMTPGSYDHGAERFRSVEELRALMAKADEKKLPLYVNFGFRGLYQGSYPDILKLLDDPQFFEPVAKWHGLFISTTREVVRYKGAAPK